jgi:hypothetical protein
VPNGIVLSLLNELEMDGLPLDFPARRTEWSLVALLKIKQFFKRHLRDEVDLFF